MTLKFSRTVCEKALLEVFPLGKSSLLRSASVHIHLAPVASVAVPCAWMVVPMWVPCAFSVARKRIVNRPVPVMTPASGGVSGHTGYAGTVRSTEKRSWVAAWAVTRGDSAGTSATPVADGPVRLIGSALPPQDAVTSPTLHRIVIIRITGPNDTLVMGPPRNCSYSVLRKSGRKKGMR